MPPKAFMVTRGIAEPVAPMRALVSLSLISAMTSITFPAQPRHCTHWDTTTSTLADTNPEGIEDVPRYYADSNPNRFNEGILGVSWRVYEESNGIDGLQRGDEEIDDTCHGMIPADTAMV